jgi:hypothetical protein
MLCARMRAVRVREQAPQAAHGGIMRIEALSGRGPILAALTAIPLLLSARAAQAQSCQDDSNCGAGYRCASQTGISCGRCPVFGSDAGAAAFADGGLNPYDCDAGCTTFEWRYCARKSCEQDSDCPSDMRCNAVTYTSCEDAPCKPGVDCAPDASVTCSEHTERTCTERYNIPCGVDEECGEGFDCNRDPYTSCWGSGGGSYDGDGGFIAWESDGGCTTETPEAGWCNLLELPCASDSECPSGLSCQDSYSSPPCVFGPRDAGAIVWDGGAPLPDEKSDAGILLPGDYYCPPPVARRVCQPERWAVDGGSGGLLGGGLIAGGGLVGGGTIGGLGGLGGAELGGLGGGLVGGGPLDAGVVEVDSGTSAPPTGTPGGSGALGGAAGGGTGGGSSGSADAGSDDDGDEDEHGHGHHHGGWRSLLRGLFGAGGCSLGGEPAQGNLAWFALMSGLLVLRTRRRD